MVTTRQANGKTYVLDMLDIKGDGGIEEVVLSTSWTIQSDTGVPMMYSDRNYILTNHMLDTYASGLQHVLQILAAEKKLQPGE
jgi:hypothetical protein